MMKKQYEKQYTTSQIISETFNIGYDCNSYFGLCYNCNGGSISGTIVDINNFNTDAVTLGYDETTGRVTASREDLLSLANSL